MLLQFWREGLKVFLKIKKEGKEEINVEGKREMEATVGGKKDGGGSVLIFLASFFPPFQCILLRKKLHRCVVGL